MKPTDESAVAVPVEALVAQARVQYALVVVGGILVTFVGLGILALMAVPLAHAIAGKHTDFSLTVSLSLSAVLTVTTALSAGGLAVQTRRVRHHKSRAEKLESQIKGLDKG